MPPASPNTSLQKVLKANSRNFLAQVLQKAKPQRIRSRVEFAEQCIVLPEGKYRDRKWRPEYQPYSYHLLHMMDTSGFRRFAVSGCVQSGKTLTGVVIPLCWHLFERAETVIYGVPTMDTAKDKWYEEIKPVIDASPELRRYLPTSGAGSRGGAITTIRFTNGCTLKFMSAQGRDDRRSAFTAPVVVKTEVDRFDEAGEVSRETDPARQLDARTDSYGDQAHIYEECTVTTEQGRIWTLLEQGTNTKLYSRCPHCGEWICPGRDELIGWQDAHSVYDAAELGSFCCPKCSVLISEDERQAMLDELVPAHRGQTVEDGVATGDVPKTDLLSFSWNGWHNRFHSTDFIVKKEWEASRSKHFEAEEKARRQFTWTLPAEPDEFDVTPLTIDDVLEAQRDRLTLGKVPEGYDRLSAGVDLRKRQLHFSVFAWNKIGQGHLVDCGTLKVDHLKLGVDQGLVDALRRFRERCERGWQGLIPKWVLVDAGWMRDPVFFFARESKSLKLGRYLPTFGRGRSQKTRQSGTYSHPKKQTDEVRMIGEQYYATYYKQDASFAIFVNSDHWKTHLHEGLAAAEGAPGHISVWEAETDEQSRLLRTWGRQVCAERARMIIKPDQGPVKVWVQDSRHENHYLDTSYLACASAHMAGVTILQAPMVEVKPEQKQPPKRRPDGRAMNLFQRQREMRRRTRRGRRRYR